MSLGGVSGKFPLRSEEMCDARECGFTSNAPGIRCREETLYEKRLDWSQPYVRQPSNVASPHRSIEADQASQMYFAVYRVFICVRPVQLVAPHVKTQKLLIRANGCCICNFGTYRSHLFPRTLLTLHGFSASRRFNLWANTSPHRI